ncbi:MAG: glycosyltransferase [Pseudolabrys sp.]
MLSAIISTHESERLLVPTLAALVPGATSGVLTDVIVADGNSSDETEKVADIAGCKFVSSDAPAGTRLREAARQAKSPWLMFLRAGTVPDPGWIAALERFIEDADHHGTTAVRAATFRRAPAGGIGRSAFAEATAALRDMVRRAHRPDQGLVIHRRFYDQLGGHPDSGDAETLLMRRLGGRRIAMLGATVTQRALPADT